MTTAERAATRAAERIRGGMSPALAVFKAAGEYGTTTGAVAAGLRARRLRRNVRRAAAVGAVTGDEWWNR